MEPGGHDFSKLQPSYGETYKICRKCGRSSVFVNHFHVPCTETTQMAEKTITVKVPDDATVEIRVNGEQWSVEDGKCIRPPAEGDVYLIGRKYHVLTTHGCDVWKMELPDAASESWYSGHQVSSAKSCVRQFSDAKFVGTFQDLIREALAAREKKGAQ